MMSILSYRNQTTNSLCALLTVALLLAACTSSTHHRLEQIAMLVDSVPETARLQLDSIDSGSLNRGDAALYALLKTQADYKNNIPINDSLLETAINHYENGTDSTLYGKCLLYKGIGYLHQQKYPQAGKILLKSIDCLKTSHVGNCLAMAYSYLGKVYAGQELFEQAIHQEKMSLAYYIQQRDSADISISYSLIAGDYAYLHLDSAIYYYQQALRYVNRFCDPETYGQLLHNCSVCCCLKDDITASLGYQQQIRDSIQDPVYRAKYESLSARLLQMQGYTTQAEQLQRQVMATTTDINLLRSSAYSLYQMAMEKEVYKEAVSYMNQYLQYDDSIQSGLHSAEIALLEKKYNHEKLAKDNLQIKAEILRKNTILAILAFLLTITLLITNRIVFYDKKKHATKLKLKDQLMEQNKKQLQVYEERLVYNQCHLEELRELLQKNLEQTAIEKQDNDELKKEIHRLEIKQQQIQPFADYYQQQINGFLQQASTKALAHLEEIKQNPKKFYLKAIDFSLLRSLFNLIYPEAYASMDNSPLLPQEKDLCILFGLGVSNETISLLKGISKKSVNTSKYRLKKKVKELNVPEEKLLFLN